MKIKLHYGRSRYAPHPCTLTSAHRYQSTLEFDLRLQEYIELARARKTEEAIAYTKKHMIQWQETHLSQIRAASALLAFPPETTCGPYKVGIDATSRSWLIIYKFIFPVAPLRPCTLVNSRLIFPTRRLLPAFSSDRTPSQYRLVRWSRSPQTSRLLRSRRTKVETVFSRDSWPTSRRGRPKPCRIVQIYNWAVRAQHRLSDLRYAVPRTARA